MTEISLKKERTVPKWETEARDRLRAVIKKYTKPLAELCTRDANEGDTRLIVTDFLCDGLGYDKYAELTTEYRVKGEFADFGIRLDQQMFAFIEVKRVNTKLGEKHLRQVQSYAMNEGCEWVLLTNGHTWQIYHLTAALPMQTDLVLEADILSEEPINQKINKFFSLTRESMKRGHINILFEARRATSPKSLADLLFAPSVLDALRKELKKKTGQAVDNRELLDLLKTTVIKSDCF
jgi:predicted type IV restriction endonuclease